MSLKSFLISVLQLPSLHLTSVTEMFLLLLQVYCKLPATLSISVKTINTVSSREATASVIGQPISAVHILVSPVIHGHSNVKKAELLQLWKENQPDTSVPNAAAEHTACNTGRELSNPWIPTWSMKPQILGMYSLKSYRCYDKLYLY